LKGGPPNRTREKGDPKAKGGELPKNLRREGEWKLPFEPKGKVRKRDPSVTRRTSGAWGGEGETPERKAQSTAEGLENIHLRAGDQG